MQENTIQNLRILVVLPFYGGSLPIGRYCVSALQNLGHQVETFQAPEFHEAFKAIKNLHLELQTHNYFEQSFLNLVSRLIQAKVEQSKPDLVLCLAQAPMSTQTLKRLRQDGVPTAMWFVEDYRLFTYWRTFAPHYDFFFVIQKEPFLSELAAAGVENACYLPLAALPDFHKPSVPDSAEQQRFGSDLSFLGAGYPNRRVAFRRLLPFDFKIWGTEWDGDPLLKERVQMQGARISSEDAVKIYNSSKINLNLHSSVQVKDLVTGGDFVNPRTFELAACGAFQLVDKRSLMAELFAEDDLATFASLDELVEKIQYFLDHPAERQAYTLRARERVLAEHSYEKRMQSLLEFIAQRKSGWPAPRDKSGMEAMDALINELPTEMNAGLTEDLRADLFRLLQKLNLPVSVGFPDMVAAIRGQNGNLEPLESAILFLDEWRKQYGMKNA